MIRASLDVFFRVLHFATSCVVPLERVSIQRTLVLWMLSYSPRTESSGGKGGALMNLIMNFLDFQKSQINEFH